MLASDLQNKNLNENILDTLTSIGGTAFDAGMFLAQSYGVVLLVKGLFRFIGSHWITKQLRDIENKVEQDKDTFTNELIDVLNKKIIHRPLNELNDDELAEAIEKLVQLYGGDEAYKYMRELKHYNDAGMGNVYLKIKNNLNTTYRSVFKLFYNLIKLKYETDQSEIDAYKNAIYANLEDLYHLTQAKANIMRALYNAFPFVSSGDKTDYDEDLRKYISKQRMKNIEFDERGNFTGNIKHYKTGYSQPRSISFGDK